MLWLVPSGHDIIIHLYYPIVMIQNMSMFRTCAVVCLAFIIYGMPLIECIHNRMMIFIIFASVNAHMGSQQTFWILGFDQSILKEKLIMKVVYLSFLHNLPWISPWIKSISNKLDINIHIIMSQLSGHCDVISNRLWCHQQNQNRASETWGQCVKIVIFIVIYESVMSCKK